MKTMAVTSTMCCMVTVSGTRAHSLLSTVGGRVVCVIVKVRNVDPNTAPLLPPTSQYAHNVLSVAFLWVLYEYYCYWNTVVLKAFQGVILNPSDFNCTDVVHKVRACQSQQKQIGCDFDSRAVMNETCRKSCGYCNPNVVTGNN